MIRAAFISSFLLRALTAVSADELQSGPQIGSRVPGQFDALNINGPNAGEEFCLYCHYGNARVVMVFASRTSEELKKLVVDLEKAALAAGKDAEIGACMILTETSRESKAWLSKLAYDKNLKKVVLATVDREKVKDYMLSADAELTMLLYSNRVVRGNHAFKTGELNAKVVTKLITETEQLFGVK